MGDRALGRGLDAFFGVDEEKSSESTVMLPIAKVEPRAEQPRKVFDPKALETLCDSIRQHGLLQPLTVRAVEGGYYQIIMGERRWRAARMAGLTEVPALIIEADDRKAMELALIENLQREDLNPLEEAEGYKSLMENFGLTQEELAKRVGVSRPSVANALRLLGLPEAVKKLLEDGKITSGHARALMQVDESAKMEALASKIVTEGLSVRQAEQLGKKLSTKNKAVVPQASRLPAPDYLTPIEETLSSKLGRRVKIVNGRSTGRFELEFYDAEDFERLRQALESLIIKDEE